MALRSNAKFETHMHFWILYYMMYIMRYKRNSFVPRIISINRDTSFTLCLRAHLYLVLCPLHYEDCYQTTSVSPIHPEGWDSN